MKDCHHDKVCRLTTDYIDAVIAVSCVRPSGRVWYVHLRHGTIVMPACVQGLAHEDLASLATFCCNFPKLLVLAGIIQLSPWPFQPEVVCNVKQLHRKAISDWLRLADDPRPRSHLISHCLYAMSNVTITVGPKLCIMHLS